jgi:hypothetical protein
MKARCPVFLAAHLVVNHRFLWRPKKTEKHEYILDKTPVTDEKEPPDDEKRIFLIEDVILAVFNST